MAKLSEAQKEILTIEYFYPDTSATTVGIYINVGKRELKYVEDVVREFMGLHETFRLKLKKEGEEITRYYVSEPAPIFVEHCNEEEIKRACEEKSGRNFFAWDDYLYEMGIHVADNGNVYLTFFAHHLIIDGLGVHLYIKGIHDLLATGTCDQPLLSLDECVEEEQAYDASSRSDKSKQFWRGKIEAYDGVALADMRKLDATKLRTSNHNTSLSGELTQQLASYCESNGITLTQLISGAVLLYKSKMTNNTSVAMNATLHGRSNRKKRGVLSTFARALPLMVNLDDESSILDYLDVIKSEMSGLMRNYKISHYDLMSLTKNTSGLDDMAVSVQVKADLKENYYPVLIEGAWFMPKESMRPLTIHISEDSFNYETAEDGSLNEAEGLQLNYEFLGTIYEVATIAQMHEKLSLILSQMIASTETLVKDITLLTSEEREFLVNDYQKDYVPYPKDQTIVDVFEEQVAKNPNHTALIYKDVTLTYEELNKKANQLAHYLIENHNIQPEDKVGLLLDRSEWMIISMLGVLKAGGAYVPISPEYPKDRVDYIVEMADLVVTLTEEAFTSQVDNPVVIRALDLSDYLITNPKAPLTPTNLAYILFTSGTTGRPKGVMIEHRNVNNFVPAMRKACGFYGTEQETILMLANYVFDATVDQIYSALLSGDRLLITPDGLWMETEKLTAYLNEHKVTYIQATSSLLLQMDLDQMPSLKYVVPAGESISSNLLDKARGLNFSFINAYGPTESTVATNVYRYEGKEERNIIGYALDNVTLYVLDSNRRPVSKGVIGELYVGGVQLSRGYVKQPELTAERFISNPFQTETQITQGWNDRLYQTGDLVRMLECGAIEYHGRSDFQVKIRGYRIELGEIEETLLQLPEISQVHVMALGPLENPYLGAYYVSEDVLDEAILIEALAQKLPDYMIPSGYCHMTEFPLTVNGKLDRRALPEIASTSAVEYVAPTTEMEAIVAEGYGAVLEMEQVGINDDFFKLGGHSLRALRLVNLLEERTGKAIGVKHVFETPKVVDLAVVLEGLEASNYERIPKAEARPFYEMSGAQKRMYLLWKFAPEVVAYNMPAMLDFDHHLDEVKLTDAINALTARHDILRTTFTEREGELVQVILPSLTSRIIVTELEEDDVKGWRSRLIQPFNLEEGPLYRLEIGRTKARDYLFVDMHHIISDGMSSTIFVNELSALIDGEALPTLERQYKDYSEWMASLDLTESENYWLASLEDYPILELQTDYPRPKQQQYEGATERLTLDSETTGQIKALIQKTGTTEYMFFMGLISILLGKLANQDDVVIGSPISGRVHRDTETMLGMFVNTLAMRVKPQGEKTFISYLEELKAQSLAAQDHQAYPFENLVGHLIENRDPSRNPLFDVLMVYQNNEQLSLLMGTGAIEELEPPAKFDLTFTLSDDGNQTFIELAYATSLFSQSTIQMYLERFTQLLSQVLVDANQPIADLNALLVAEEQELVLNMGREYVDYPSDKTLVDLFEEQVESNPTTIAVIYKDIQLTYEELNVKANQLAHYLIDTHNIKPEDKVGLLLDRSDEMVVAILGVLKAGAAYVPVSPEHPEDRMAYIAEVAEFKTALIESHYGARLSNAEILSELELTGYPTTNPITDLTANNLAYVLFTSGTTGRPKGVMIEHHNVHNLVLGRRKVSRFREEDQETILFASNYVFDASVDQIFSALICGDRLLVSPEQLWMEPEKFTAYLREHQVTYVQMTPSLLLQLDFDSLSSVRYVMAGGESVTSNLLDKVKNQNFVFINGYGPTEATVATHAYVYEGDEIRNIIGYPLPNTTMYVLDQSNRLVPKGTIGELYVGGMQISRGYVKQPDLTAERFMTNPFQTDAQKAQGWNDRLYQTGDLVRMLEDGSLEYHGRSDFQVKIRGYRIELGEIENALLQVPGVTKAHVIALGAAGNEYIGAYYVSEAEIDPEVLNAEIGAKVPDYMIPSGYQHMEDFPLTVNGKVDRRALPEIGFSSQVAYVAPRNEEEEALCQAFKEILGAHIEIGIDDGFFVLGGDSIKAIRIISKLREKGFQTDVRNIMEHRTPREIAKTLEIVETLLIDQGEVTGEVPLTPIQTDFILNNDPSMHHFNQSMMLESEERVDETVLRRTLNELVRHHDMLRATYADGSQELHAYEEGKSFDLVIHDFISIADEAELKVEIEAASNDIQRSINLETGPLFKVGLFKGAEKDYLLLCIHHLVVDGVSWRILVEDFQAAYQLIDGEQDVVLPQKTSSFKDWRVALGRYLESGRLNKELPYWKEMEQYIDAGNMPAEHNDDVAKAVPLTIELSQEQTANLMQAAPQAYHAKLNDLLLTAVVHGISKVTNQDIVSINMEGHGREDIREEVVIDRTVGWFTSVYPVVLRGVNQEMEQDISNVKETLRRIPSGGIGYGVLKSLGDDLLTGKQPAVTFNYLGEFVAEGEEGRFTGSDMLGGRDVSEDNTFTTPVSIDSLIVEGKLGMTISYDGSMYSHETMERLQVEIGTQLDDVLAHCLTLKAPIHTASDFGELSWSHDKFKQVMTKFKRQGYALEHILPLTSMQEGMLYHKLLDPTATEYVVQTTFKVTSHVSHETLKRSLELLTKKHQVLRSSIVYKDVKEPRQVVLKERDVAFTVLDLSGKTSSPEALKKIYEQDVLRGFDLEDDPLVRLMLIKLTDDEYRMAMTFHHVIMDGWCTSILMNELLTFYAGLAQGKLEVVELANVSEQAEYSDYVRFMSTKEVEPAKAYWKNLLADYEGAGTIPPLGTSQMSEKGLNNTTKAELTTEQTRKLEDVAKDYGVTLNTLVEAAWGLLLQRYNNEQDVVFGKVVSGRNRDLLGIETMIGLFINNVPVRVTTTDGMTFAELVKNLQDQALTTGEYDYYDLAEIQKLSNVGSHLIQSILTFENYMQQEPTEASPLNLEFEGGREEVNYDLAVTAHKSDGLTLAMEFNPLKYGKGEANDILNRLKTILCDVLGNPEKKVSEMNALTEKEHTTFMEVGRSYVETPTDGTILDLIEAQVAEVSTRVAIEYKDVQLTYEELNAKANQLAHYLIATYDIKPGDKVGLLLDRSDWMMVSILGVLKAGAAFVPISPDHPEDRKTYIAETAEIKTALVDAHYASSLVRSTIVQDLDLNHYPTTTPKAALTPDNLAYVIFTSGTTGNPKGVMLAHKNLSHYMDYVQKSYITKTPIVPLFTNYTFDLTITSIFLPFITGGKMIVYNGEVHEDIEAIFSNDEITFAKMTPSHLEMAAMMKDPKPLPNLESLILGGEELTTQLSHQTLKTYGEHIQIHNEYGPTEATVGCCDYVYKFEDDNRLSVSIGKPIDNIQIYILNDLSLCGTGMIGELCIAGAGVAKGYIKRPDLTAEKFISNPFGSGKLYRTGDLAKWLPDGTIDYLGRMDDQVKIRGFRIELGEIEETLLHVPGVKQAHVMPLGEASNLYLGAYYVADTEIARDVLDAALSQKLPDYMIPSGYQHMTEFPLTINGKIDRRALPEIGAGSGVEYVAPTTEMEQIVAVCFEDVLELDQVGIHDDFFKLGGHSLRALRLVNLLEEHAGKAVQVKHIFEAPKVAGLATLLEGLGDVNYKSIPKAFEKPAYEMSSTQKRMYILWKFNPHETTYNMPAMLKFNRYLDEVKLTEAINAMTARHDILRTTFTEIAGTLVQVISESLTSRVLVTEMAESEVQTWYANAAKPFNLEEGPMFCVEIVRTPERDYLFVDMHHIISDGMSQNIFVAEINALMEGTPIPAASRQYKDYSEWMRAQDLSTSENYWLESLEDYPILELPLDLPRPKQQQFKGATEKLTLDAETTGKIKALLRKTNTTEYMFFMGVISILLGKLANQEDIVIGTPVSGRIHRDTESMLGMFVNTLAMRMNPDGSKTFDAYLDELKTQTLEAGEHQMYPFEDLVDQLVTTRDRSRGPLFDVLMVYQNNEEAGSVMGSEAILEGNAPAQFDLSFNLSDDGNETFMSVTYATSLFNQATIQTYLIRFTQLLGQILTNTAQQIADLNLLLPMEEQELLAEMGSRFVDYPKDKTVVDVFEEQVLRNPNAVAVAYKDLRLTFAELNDKANQLAHYLIGNYDIQPEDKIGLLLDRSEWMIISILGVMKAGAAYVPISPEHPKDRMAYIAEVAEFKTALVETRYVSSLAKAEIVQDINLDNYSTMNPTTNLKPNSLAYTLFTSGTTGVPKGVMIEHHQLNNLVPAMKEIHQLKDEGENILFFTNYVFDQSVEQIFLPLLGGYTMIIAPDNLWMNPEEFTAYLNEHEVTYIHMTPSMLLQVHLDKIPTLRNLVAGGESVTSNLLDKVRDLDLHFINLYGPTEATVNSTSHLIDVNVEKNIIGGPVTNMTLYVLGDNRRPVPKGTIGELYVGGVQVSRGYVKQPDLTAERFIPNPFQTEKQKSEGWNDRIYQTGDLVRFLEDGTLEYFGRTDFQVKIRGHRIELGEIEETLLQIPVIRQAHVRALGETGNQYLGAYYVADVEISQEILDKELGGKLPDYMIPAGYQHMEEFPLTVNGKLDQRALPTIGFESTVAYVAPTTEMETMVATSFEEVLDLDQVGIHDDFFKLGGHSLRALRLVNLLEERTGKAIQVKHVFEAPKVVQLATLIEGLADSTYEGIPLAKELSSYEMSSTQKRMYLLWKFTPNEVVYNMPAMLKFTNRIDEVKLAKAINAMTARHETLRTTFTEVAGVLVQVISPSLKTNVLVTEMEESEIKAWQVRSVKPFNLEIGPIFCVEIARTEVADYLFVDMHHIISDGMSQNIFVSEINALMDRVELPALERQYKDYSEWMKTQDLSDSENYWLSSLDDYPILELPTDHPRPAEQQFDGNAEQLVLDAETTAKIKAFIQQTNTTEYMFYLGVIGILLSKLANQDDLIIGTPVSGRIHRETESMLGMFVNTLAMRVAPNGTKTFATYLDELKVQTLEAQNHQAYPFEDLVEQLVTTRDRSRSPLFDVLMVYQNNEDVSPIMGSEALAEINPPAKFDLTFVLSDDGKQTFINLAYATSLFSQETIQAYLARLTQLLHQVLRSPNQPIQDLNVLLEIEERELVLDIGREFTPYSNDKTIVQVFEEQVAKNPTNIAVIFKDIQLTYEELNAKANQLAHYLIDVHGTKPEDKIGLLLDRSEWMIISMLGVLKAGAAYVPVSPEHPEDRVAYIAETAEFKTALVEAHYKSSLANTEIVQDLDLDGYKATNPETNLTPTNLAYILFTSGTTGKPKGVMIEHHSVNNLIPSMRKGARFEERSVETILFSANYVFDASVDQIFSALLSGDRLLIAPNNLWMDREAFSAYLNEHQTTYLQSTPSLLLQLDLAQVPSLKYVMAGGESVTSNLLEKVLSLNLNFVNGYGPTEATVCTNLHLCEDTTEVNIIGKPLPNMTSYVLDKARRPVPKGTIGELYVGGVQLARGYIKQPDLTAERFIINPFQTEAQKAQGWNDRLYQTGDLVRMLEDGSLEYHGRSDFQVKIRGYRIELGEIENALLQVPGVTKAHVIALGAAGNEYVGAYYVSEAEIDQEVLNAEIGAKVPDYMIPSGYQHMGDFPLTVNGKVDRRALPEIGFSSQVEYVAPSTEMEEIVAQGYEEILELDQVGINDDFFLLGGHSLRALRLVNLLEERTGKAIEIRHIFETSKVIDLAVVMESLSDSIYERIPLAEEKPFYEMSSTQKRMYLLWKFNPEVVAYNMPIALTFESKLDETKLIKAINKLSDRHEILRTTFTEKAGELVQVISKSVKTNVLVNEMTETEVKSWFERVLQPFDLENGPMYRVEIARTPEKDYLFVDMHHIISDGMSSTIFVNEINQLMSDVELPVLDRQYKDYSEWLNGKDLSGSENYWLTSLEDYPVLELQTDHVRPMTQQFEGGIEKLVLDEVTTSKIKELIGEINSTEYMFFMGLISVLLGKLANQDDLVIGSPVSGRVHRDTESMLGMFVNTLAMRLQPEGNKTFASYLEELKTQTLEAQSHQVYPFEDLVEKLVDSRDASRNPLFDVLLVYQNNEATGEIMGSSTMADVDVPAKFDLMFSLADNGKETFVELTYATSLFTESTIKTYLERLTLLLDQILSDTNLPIKELDAVLEAERTLILSEFNNTTTDFPAELSIAAQFEAQVKANPKAIAVEDKNGSLTYAELDAKANGVAQALIDNGLQSEDFVAIVAKRNIDTVIGFLAALKAGGAYMPIDADYPESRISFMLEDSEAKIILGQEGDLPVTGDYIFIDPSTITPQEKAPTIIANGNNLAYLIYTSGTTGNPKGVMIEQQSITRLVKNTNYADFNDVRILQTGSLSFDASTFEIWGALLNGGYVFIADMNVLVDDAKLKSMISDLSINTMWLTGSLYNHLITVDVTVFDNLDQLLIGGEALSKLHVDKLLNHNSNINLINGYGPTETTTFAVTLTMNGPLPFNKIPIGKPIANTTNYIVTDGKLAGIGVPGELLIGGPGLARGYLNNPELTAEKFIDNPFGEGKLYRTGDLVSWLPDGHIAYLGRFDDQVKVRGHRIELGEIESALRALDEIDHAVLVVREGQLHAYLQNPTSLPHEEIKSRLNVTLPDYMIPTHFMDLETFPVTSNGKVNKRALPIIEVTHTVEYVAPSTEMEEIVAQGYEEILELDQVGINDDFFLLGGHSLRALRLVNLLEERTGKAIEIRHIFETSKVIDLAVVMESLSESIYERIPLAEEKPFYEMSAPQQRMYKNWKYAEQKNGVGKNMPIRLKVKDRLDETLVQYAFEVLVARHEIFRTTFMEQDGKPLQVIHDTMPVHVTVDEMKEADVSKWFSQNVKPFDLEKGPTFKIKLARTESHDHLLVDMHHIISDGRSHNNLIQELLQIFAGLPLPALDRQYKDYSEWMNAQDLSQSEAYWLERLDGYQPLQLPSDYPRSARENFDAKTHTLVLDEATTTRIKAFIKQTGTTEYMFFLALLSILLGKHAKQEDVLIGSVMSGRTHRDTESMLGVFTNTMGMRTAPVAGKPFNDYLFEVRVETFGAYDHQTYPLSSLPDDLVKKPDATRDEIFDVLYIYQNNEVTDLTEMGLVEFEEYQRPETPELYYTLGDDGKEITCLLAYATELFKPETIENLQVDLKKLIEQVLENSEATIDQLEI